VVGDGTNLANTILPQNQNQLPPLAPVPAVGSVYSPTIDISNLGHQLILRLVQYYNENFDIQLGDTVPTRSQKVLNWLTSD
jgi:hypothetical protein